MKYFAINFHPSYKYQHKELLVVKWYPFQAETFSFTKVKRLGNNAVENDNIEKQLLLRLVMPTSIAKNVNKVMH